MLFSSIIFLYYFLPVTMLIYFFIPKKYKNIFLFLISLFFYAWGEPRYVFLMIFSIYINYRLGMRMLSRNKRKNKRTLIIAVIFNIGLLVYFKYTGFIVENINKWFNLNITINQIKLPLGISFFTFQALSYVIDVYRKDAKVQTSFMKLGLYISAYPQLVAGPIVRYNTVMDQIDDRNNSLYDISEGIFKFSIGLFKKIVLANQFAQISDWIFIKGDTPSTVLAAWIGIISYSLQIYYDFSGYSDMAIGLGRMLGFKYEENFNYPYISKSITEFWRRWHISLGNWFRDYLYIPLGGNRVSTQRHIFNLLIVWLMTGLWHGAQWNFIIWGLYYFVLLVIEKYIPVVDKIPGIIKRLLTLILISIGWVIFRSESLIDAISYIKAMFGITMGNHRVMGNHIILNDYKYLFIVGILGCSEVFKNLWTRFNHIANKNIKIKNSDISNTKLINLEEDGIYIKKVKDTYVVEKRSIVVLLIQSIICLIILLISTMYLVNSTYNPFIYFRF